MPESPETLDPLVTMVPKQVDSIESTKVLPESAEQLLQNGVDLVVLSGAGCLGGSRSRDPHWKTRAD